MSASPVPAEESVRVCHLRTIPNFTGYGFSLRTDIDNDRHLIENVEPKSPASFGGLLGGDTILKINGKLVGGLSHKEVVAIIREHANDVVLLVAPEHLLKEYRKYEDFIFQVEKDAIFCSMDLHADEKTRHMLKEHQLTEAEKQLVCADLTTMNLIMAKRRQFSIYQGGNQLNNIMAGN